MKFKPFLILIVFSAISIAVSAALFSVTGIASLFAGHFITVAIMAASLELGKIIVASFLYRNWNNISKLFKYYLVIIMLVLMTITSAGIFGYLSEAYQETKGDYTLTENNINILKSKRDIFINRKNRLNNDKELEVKTKQSNQLRADSLTARGQSISRTREDIKQSELKITELENYISAAEDSIGYYDLKIVNNQSTNIKGDLGPLSYIADTFNTDMDTVVKFFIFLLIFVFDPLAVSLVVAANISFYNNSNTNVEFTEMLFSNKTNNNDDIQQETNVIKSTSVEPKSNDNNNMHASENNTPDVIQSDKTSELDHETKLSKGNKPKWHSANWKE